MIGATLAIELAHLEPPELCLKSRRERPSVEVQGLESGIQGLRSGVQDLGSGVQGLGSGVQGLGSGV